MKWNTILLTCALAGALVVSAVPTVEQEVARATFRGLHATDPPGGIDAQTAIDLLSTVAGLPDSALNLAGSGVVCSDLEQRFAAYH